MDNRFVLLTPCYNAEKTIERMLASIRWQSYDNWISIIRSDLSTDGTIEKIIDFCNKNDLPYCHIRDGDEYAASSDTKVFIIENTEKMWEVRNVLAMLKEDFLNPEDIICRIDGDDYLCDLLILEDINRIYSESDCDCLWTGHRWSGTEKVVKHTDEIYTVDFYQISAHMPNGVNPYNHPWVSSHLKTWRKKISDKIPESNYKIDGDYPPEGLAGDQFCYLPVLWNSKKKVFLPRAAYWYNIDFKPELFHTDDAKYQKDVGQKLRMRGYLEE